MTTNTSSALASVAARRRRREGGQVLLEFKVVAFHHGRDHQYTFQTYVQSDARALSGIDAYRKLSAVLKDASGSLQRKLPQFALFVSPRQRPGSVMHEALARAVYSPNASFPSRKRTPRALFVRFSHDGPGWDWQRERWI